VRNYFVGCYLENALSTEAFDKILAARFAGDLAVGCDSHGGCISDTREQEWRGRLTHAMSGAIIVDRLTVRVKPSRAGSRSFLKKRTKKLLLRRWNRGKIDAH
jgi:hypothetical protein